MEQCEICGTEGYDRRTLRISMFYQLTEISDLFKRDEESGLYLLRMCKGCRSALMTKLSEWIQERGRMKYGNLDDDGILCFSSKEEFLAYQSSTQTARDKDV